MTGSSSGSSRFAITASPGRGFFGPESGSAKLVEADGRPISGGQDKIRRLWRSPADRCCSSSIIFDMAVKPEWGDVSLWIAVLAFSALAAVLVRNGLNAQLAGGPAPARD